MIRTRFYMLLIVMLLSFALVGVALASDHHFIYPRLQPILDTSFKLAPVHVNQGDPIHYSVVIHNTGVDPALSTTLTDVVPNGTTYVPGSLTCDSGSCTYDSGTNMISWSGEVGTSGTQNISGTGVDDISASTVNFINPAYFSPNGETTDLCFNVTISSPDLEYLDGFDFTLPSSWTVTSVTDVPGNWCPYGHTFGVDPGNVVYWRTKGMPSDCGDWKSPGTYNFCANVSVPARCTNGWGLPWNIIGDTWGALPHSVSGTTAANCGLPPHYTYLPMTQKH